ncbi:MAG: WD40/YVTN/BNR-like repeat-containing protein [Thermoanaerobaculia bacterium]
MRKALGLCILLVVTSVPAVAGWSRAGLYGADVRALLVAPKDPDLLFLGTSQGEVYVSTDGAASWDEPRGAAPFPGHVVDNLIVDARGRLWVAAWGLWGGSVVAVSEDRAQTWERRDGGIARHTIRALAVSASDPDVVVAGGLDGVWLSRDAGMTWTRISDQVNVGSVAIDPQSPDTIYVGTWRQAWRSDDGGATWKHIAKGMVLDTDVFSISIDPENPQDVWISTCGWVYSSSDRGDSWTRHKEGFENRRIHVIERGPVDDATLYAGSVAGLYCSRNAGQSWSLVSPDSLVINGIAVHPERPQRIVLGTEGDGVYVSDDGGESWKRSSRGLYNVRVASVVTDPVHENRVYAVVFFGGSASGLYVSSDGGANWARLNETALPQVLSLVVRKDVSPRFLAGTERGFWWSDDGVAWERAEPLITPIRVERLLEYNRERLFAATAHGVFTSSDGGKRWYRLGIDEPVADVALGRIGAGPALYALTGSGLRVFDGKNWSPVAGSPESGRTLVVRRDGAHDLVFVGGAEGVRGGHVDHTKRWIPAKTPAGDRAAVHAATHATDTVFVSFDNRHEIHLFAGADPSWTTVPVPTRLRDLAAVAADPFRENRFYLGTHGQGILIWDESQQPAREPVAGGYLSAGGSK